MSPKPSPFAHLHPDHHHAVVCVQVLCIISLLLYGGKERRSLLSWPLLMNLVKGLSNLFCFFLKNQLLAGLSRSLILPLLASSSASFIFAVMTWAIIPALPTLSLSKTNQMIRSGKRGGRYRGGVVVFILGGFFRGKEEMASYYLNFPNSVSEAKLLGNSQIDPEA